MRDIAVTERILGDYFCLFYHVPKFRMDLRAAFIYLRGYCCNPYMYSWFQNFAVFWMSYYLCYAIPRRLNVTCRRLGTLCSVFIEGVSGKSKESHPVYSSCLHRLWRLNKVFRNVGIYISDAGNHPKERIQQCMYFFKCINEWCRVDSQCNCKVFSLLELYKSLTVVSCGCCHYIC